MPTLAHGGSCLGLRGGVSGDGDEIGPRMARMVGLGWARLGRVVWCGVVLGGGVSHHQRTHLTRVLSEQWSQVSVVMVGCGTELMARWWGCD
jgi:hypothetical protein